MRWRVVAEGHEDPIYAIAWNQAYGHLRFWTKIGATHFGADHTLVWGDRVRLVVARAR